MGEPLRVLMAEESADFAEAVRGALTRDGRELSLQRVPGLADLYAALLRAPWDLVLVNCQVPGVSQVTTLKLLRQRCPDTPLLMVAQECTTEQACQALAAGADDCVLRADLGRLARVTERVLRDTGARRDLRRSVDQLRQLSRAVERGPASIVITDAQANIEYVNPKFTEVTGFTLEEVRGKNTRILKSGEQPPEFYHALWETISGGKEWRGEFRNRKKNGELYWESASISALTDDRGRITHYMAVKEDITPRKQAEQQLLESESRLRTVLEAVREGITFGDERGRFEIYNLTMERLTGYTLAEANASGDFIALLVPDPEDRARVQAGLADMVYKRSGRESEVRVRTKAGETRYFFISSTVVPYRGRRMLLNVYRDWTRQRAGQEALRQAHEELEQRVQQRTAELRRAHEELEHRVEERTAELARSNADLEQFAYAASHDLQEPLRMVASYTDLLARRYQGKLDKDADEFLGFVTEGVQRMRAMIEALLTYSRAGVRPKTLQPIESGAALDQALANLQVALQESGAEVTRDLLPTIVADQGLLVQVFQNFLSNAVKFRGKEPPRIHVGASRQEREWTFSVRDNGIGIEERYFSRLFALFQRLHTRQEYPGTGIGLALCKRIIERHGGRVWVESQAGKGSTFFFSIPDTGS